MKFTENETFSVYLQSIALDYEKNLYIIYYDLLGIDIYQCSIISCAYLY